MKFENNFEYPENVRCEKCSSTHITQYAIDEINGEAVGPFYVRTCEDCGYDNYQEKPFDD